jgi:hypothetical protein
MSLFGFMAHPFRLYRAMKAELRYLRRDNLMKLAILNAKIQRGEISGPALDSVTECLEAQTVQIKNKETEKLKGGS